MTKQSAAGTRNEQTTQMKTHHSKRRGGKMNRFKKFLKEEDGASLIEYVLLAALIGVAAILGMTAVGTQAEGTLQQAATDMAPAATP
jgi:pilus assembly protein Flp/PilA